MPETSTSNSRRQEQHYNDNINLIELWEVMWDGRNIIAAFTSIFAVGSVIVSLALTNIYRAETLLMPVTEGQSSQVSAQLGFAASIAGVNLNRSTDKSQVALATLQSREFITKFIGDHDLLPWLFASKYQKSQGGSVIDSGLYNTESRVWVEEVANESSTPTNWDAFKLFSGIMSVSVSRDSGLVTVSLEWPDPFLASQWVNLLVSDVNNYLRERDQEEASEAIQFLQTQLISTNLVQMERMLYQLIESQTRVLMLANVRDEYSFQVIDPSYVPEEKIWPRRSLICIIGTMLGTIIALILVFLQQVVQKRENTDAGSHKGL